MNSPETKWKKIFLSIARNWKRKLYLQSKKLSKVLPNYYRKRKAFSKVRLTTLQKLNFPERKPCIWTGITRSKNWHWRLKNSTKMRRFFGCPVNPPSPFTVLPSSEPSFLCNRVFYRGGKIYF